MRHSQVEAISFRVVDDYDLVVSIEWRFDFCEELVCIGPVQAGNEYFSILIVLPIATHAAVIELLGGLAEVAAPQPFGIVLTQQDVSASGIYEGGLRLGVVAAITEIEFEFREFAET